VRLTDDAEAEAEMSGMQIGPGYDNRATIRRWLHLSETAVCRMANVTRATLVGWEAGHQSSVPGRFSGGARGEQERADVVERLANIYAVLAWIAGKCAWPECLDDAALAAAVERVRTVDKSAGLVEAAEARAR